MTTETVNIEGRIYNIEASEENLPFLTAHLLSNGFDGLTYMGISRPVGRQRKTFGALFARVAKTGQLVKVA